MESRHRHSKSVLYSRMCRHRVPGQTEEAAYSFPVLECTDRRVACGGVGAGQWQCPRCRVRGAVRVVGQDTDGDLGGAGKLPGGGTPPPDSAAQVYIRPREGAYCR